MALEMSGMRGCVARHLFPCYCVLWQRFLGYVGSLYMGVARKGEREGRKGKINPGKRPTCISVSHFALYVSRNCVYVSTSTVVRER